MTWGTFPLPVGTSKPEVGYFAMKPTILRYQILPWAIKKWFRVYWITFQYSWNRKYWWEPEVFLNFNFWLHICNKHMICYISYDSKFYCWFTIIKIFEIRPRNFFKSFFVWAELTRKFEFSKKIASIRVYFYRIYICFRPFSLKILALNAHAKFFHANHGKIIINTRGSIFWSIKVCEGGSHVKHMHADSLLIHPNFSKLMITWLNFIENPLLIRFQTDRKLTHNSWSRDW